MSLQRTGRSNRLPTLPNRFDMIDLHDSLFCMNQLSTLTERGQVSIPAALRRQLQLKPGQHLRWEVVSGTEVRMVVEATQPDPLLALGFGPKTRKTARRRTADWMQELRAAE